MCPPGFHFFFLTGKLKFHDLPTVEPEATLLQSLVKEAILCYFCHCYTQEIGPVAQVVEISFMVGFWGTSWKDQRSEAVAPEACTVSVQYERQDTKTKTFSIKKH